MAIHVKEKPAASAPLALISWFVRGAQQTTRSEAMLVRVNQIGEERRPYARHTTAASLDCSFMCRQICLISTHRFVCRRGMPYPEMRWLLSRSLQFTYATYMCRYRFPSRVAASWGICIHYDVAVWVVLQTLLHDEEDAEIRRL